MQIREAARRAHPSVPGAESEARKYFANYSHPRFKTLFGILVWYITSNGDASGGFCKAAERKHPSVPRHHGVDKDM